MKRFAAICDTAKIFNYPPIISILAALGLNENNFKTIPLEGTLQLFCSCCDKYQGQKDIIDLLTKNNVTFDSIYCGNLSTTHDIETILNFVEKFKSDNSTIVVNPVMEDLNDTSYIGNMRTLIAKASVITPNYKEAKILLGKEGEKPSFEELKVWVKELSRMGPRVTFITDIPNTNQDSGTFVLAYDSVASAYWVIPSCYKKDEKFTFIDVLTELIIKDTELPTVMDNFL